MGHSGVAPRGSLIAAALAAIGASACCIVPLALMAVGVGEAWMSLFVACEANGVCVDQGALRRSRMTLWGITVMLVPVLTFAYYFGYLV